MQIFLNIFLVPYTQNLKQNYLKNSSLNLFPKLIQEKKFINITKKITIFIEKNEKDGILKGIYIKEKLNDNESKIITSKNGKLIKNEKGFNFKLLDGKITTISEKGSINLNFKETTYELSKLDSTIRKVNKLSETKSFILLACLEKYIDKRKNKKLRCQEENSFLIKEIYEEIFQRMVNPIYIVILSLLSSLIIIKPKINFMENYLKIILFTSGFSIILFSQLTYKFITYSLKIEMVFITLPILFIIFFYLILLIKTKFNMRFL